MRRAVIVDACKLALRDDLLIYLETEAGKQALHIAPGGRRARVCTTKRRFRRADFATGPRLDELRRRLTGTTLAAIEQAAGERCCAFHWTGTDGARAVTVTVELFGPRGLWCLLDPEGRIVELSRLATTRHRDLSPGHPYRPPPTATNAPARAEPTPRFAAPSLAEIDRIFTAADLAEEAGAEQARLERALAKAERKLGHRIDGLQRQSDSAREAPAARLRADLLLAYGFGVTKKQSELIAPHPEDPEVEVRIPLDPARSVQAQAEALYRRARKLEDSVAVTAERLAAAQAEREPLTELRRQLEAATNEDEVAAVAAALQARGVLPRERPAPADPKLAKATKGEGFRRYTSAEGYPILVGRNNQENDRLSLRVARGNDVWLHIGRGHAGSHVVVRLPRGKTASLETMLDAATLAVHFSKARGAPHTDVIYTAAKFVRKPKGLPAGAVVPGQTKTIAVRFEEARLRRLLDQQPDG